MERLPYDVSSQIFDILTAKWATNLGNVSVNMRKAYNYYRTYKCKLAGETYLYPHQISMIQWIVKNIELKGSILIEAYMSSGKTLVALEAMMRLLRGTNGMCIIYVPGTVIKIWVAECLKHYPNNIKFGKNGTFESTNILIYHSSMKSHYDYIDKGGSLDGKIIITTPTTILKRQDVIQSKAKYFVFDEAHRMKTGYGYISEKYPQIPKLYMTGSQCDMNSMGINDNYRLVDAKSRFPDITSKIVKLPQKKAYEYINQDIQNHDNTHIVIVDNNLDNYNVFKGIVTSKHIYNYHSKSRTVYNKYEENGGILFASIKSISEGCNINAASLMYIINPEKCVMQTIQQCVGRIYRESNTNPSIEVIFIIPDDDIQLYMRCRLSVTNHIGFDIKPNDRCDRIYTYLQRKGLNVESLDDINILCAFAFCISVDTDVEYIDIQQIAKEVLHCMLM